MSNKNLSTMRTAHTAMYNVLKTIEKHYPEKVPTIEYLLSLEPRYKNFVLTVAEAFWHDGIDIGTQLKQQVEGDDAHEWKHNTNKANSHVQESTRAGSAFNV